MIDNIMIKNENFKLNNLTLNDGLGHNESCTGLIFWKYLSDIFSYTLVPSSLCGTGPGAQKMGLQLELQGLCIFPRKGGTAMM
jgi:hypothetical protein